MPHAEFRSHWIVAGMALWSLFLVRTNPLSAQDEGPDLKPPTIKSPDRPAAAETPPPKLLRHPVPHEALRDAVNAELSDVASALRSLDQSYSFRGIVSRKAATGGSAWIDWRAKGLSKPEGYVRALPPPPRVLGCSSSCRLGVLCPHCAPWLYGEVPKPSLPIGPALPNLEAAPSPAPVETVPHSSNTAIEPLDRFTFTPGTPIVWRLETIGEADTTSAWLVSGHGQIRVRGLDESIVAIAGERNAWSIEAVLDHQSPSARFAPLVLSGEKSSHSNFALGIEEDQLVLMLRTDAIADGQPVWRASLTKLQAGLQHVLVSYRDGELCCYVNGERAARLENVTGRLSNWSAAPLAIGDLDPTARWSGRIGGIGLHPRFIGDEGARQRFSFAAGSVKADAQQ